MKNGVIVVFFFAELDEILAGSWNQVAIKSNIQIAEIGLNLNEAFLVMCFYLEMI